jgi:hypothetical protein
MHLTNVAALRLLGDRPSSIRAVAAVHGVLAVVMLVVLVRRFFGPVHALLAGAVYVVLPINGIYANMANHSSGFIFYSLLMLYCHLGRLEAADRGRRTRSWYLAVLGAFFMASAWDWPAYYVAFVMALHWAWVTARRYMSRDRPWRAEALMLAGFCLFVLAKFVGHFLLVRAVVGSMEDLEATFFVRQDLGWEFFLHNLRVVPALMFTLPVLAVCGLWLVALPVRARSGLASGRDVVPFAYAFAGVLHYGLFKWSAYAHCYWAWTFLPFVAIATASALVWAGRTVARRVDPLVGRRLGRRSRAAIVTAAGLSVGLVLAPLAVRAAVLVPEGRSVGGSLWFVYPVRSRIPEVYDSGRHAIRFARMVRGMTTRRTGVLMHASFKKLRPEIRINTVLDRHIEEVEIMPAAPPHRGGLEDGWVFIARAGSIHHLRRARWAARHHLLEYEDLLMVDLRRPGTRIDILVARPLPMTLGWRYLVTPFEPPVRPVHLGDMEAAMEAEVELVRAGGSSAPAAVRAPPRPVTGIARDEKLR